MSKYAKRKQLPQFTRLCQLCSAEFKTNRKNRRFCSPRCQVNSWSQAHPRLDLNSLYAIDLEE